MVASTFILLEAKYVFFLCWGVFFDNRYHKMWEQTHLIQKLFQCRKIDLGSKYFSVK